MRTPFKITDHPCRGYGKTFYEPGAWLTSAQLSAFLKKKTQVLNDLFHRCTMDEDFRAQGLKLIRVRKWGGSLFDFQTAVYLFQYLQKIKRKAKRKTKQDKLKATYYEREYKAYLSGELGTAPPNKKGYFQNLHDLGIDPFETGSPL